MPSSASWDAAGQFKTTMYFRERRSRKDSFHQLHILLFTSSSCKVLEEWPAQTSYDVGLEAERAALEKQETQDTHQEQVLARSRSKIEVLLELPVQ